MNTLRVSCWYFSDKDSTSWVSGSICVRFPIPLHCTDGLIQAPRSLTVPRAASVKPDSLLLGKIVCRHRLKRLRLSPVALCTEASKGVRTFGRRGVHFRENDTRLWDKIQVHLTPKTVLRLPLTAGKSSYCIGAGVLKTGCSVWGEEVFGLGRTTPVVRGNCR
jgi:hypothetical protein